MWCTTAGYVWQVHFVHEANRYLLLRGVHSNNKKSHLPNSRITAQTRRALSTRPRFEPRKFATDIVDCRFLQRIWAERRRSRKTKKEWAEAGKGVVSCVPEWHKFLLVSAALAPQIPSDWLNRAFQSCVDQWECRDREAPPCGLMCLLSCCWKCVSSMKRERREAKHLVPRANKLYVPQLLGVK